MRNHFTNSVLAVAALSLTAPLAAAEPAATAVTEPAKAPKPKKICRDAAASSTSRIGSGRACRTQEEWDAIAAAGPQTSSRSVQSASPDRN
jgi:hypothetical protein